MPSLTNNRVTRYDASASTRSSALRLLSLAICVCRVTQSPRSTARQRALSCSTVHLSGFSSAFRPSQCVPGPLDQRGGRADDDSAGRRGRCVGMWAGRCELFGCACHRRHPLEFLTGGMMLAELAQDALRCFFFFDMVANLIAGTIHQDV